MLDIKFVKKNKDLVIQNNQSRGVKVDVDELLNLFKEVSERIQNIAGRRTERNKHSKTKPSPEIREKMKLIGDYIQEEEKELKKIQNEIYALLAQLPNLNSTTTPIGSSEKDNQVEKTVGQKPQFDFQPLPHEELAQKLDLIDIDKGSEISGARFWYLKNQLVELQWALLNYVFGKLLKAGFQPVVPPNLVKTKAMFGTGFFPAEKNEIYHVNSDKDDLYLIGTSEVPLVSYHADEVLNLKIPIKYFALSTCYRREAGSYGKDNKGIFRGHQFDKIEMVVFCQPQESEKNHQEILAIEEEIWSELKIPYQVVNICSGDIGFQAAKKYDLEAWLPSQNKYREVTSCSNTTDFQSRRLNIKYQAGQKKELCHTLNGTGIAIGRALIAIMENYQTKEGSIKVPKVLQSYLSFKEIKK
ncbi:MAG: serine--tRNA ligase [Candidatus Komeilibacteria bacterium CG11_big_fil_rev_8_21_14_0_20_36_20]|uniref:Serine--tRNA ligase n=1 Tax=Candidatus Komeilibacteria bacterium CG11_big_fil_rev_8_21_14_0_20_36_20 TaxID=1974477 RepID=A0A2H0NBY2_9BACT|nr:MAG: serine--tRNA ligase [Candidatus Komeilibacteria bacterium CG11_big_fil_rev_8_21_14_0_20_36_20]PIR81983.1 MAG: serine--tRNA ligase [Candidatus Komeilibacteria bacterium CG10_big_fil_rev_8_21_14_0_10_36_65]PJC55521.1 MAG: serine--tRNA ligase [Candidatus Komeilibacteria bacterium CG_4_9_14_0_2_um_filter_36_13]